MQALSQERKEEDNNIEDIITEVEVLTKKQELIQNEKNHKSAKQLERNLDNQIKNLQEELSDIKEDIDDMYKNKENLYSDFEYSVRKVKWYNEK